MNVTYTMISSNSTTQSPTRKRMSMLLCAELPGLPSVKTPAIMVTAAARNVAAMTKVNGWVNMAKGYAAGEGMATAA